MPEQFEGGGEIERVAGGGDGAGEGNQLRRRCWVKKRVPAGGIWSPPQALCYS